MSRSSRQTTKIHLERSEGAARIHCTIPLVLKYVEEAGSAVHAALHVPFKNRTGRLPISAAGVPCRTQPLRCLVIIPAFPRNVGAKEPGIDGARIHLASMREIFFRGGEVFHGE